MPAPESLLLSAEETRDQQLFLFSGVSLPEIDRRAPAGEFTGERLFRDRPRIYRHLVELLAEPGVSIRKICDLLNVSDGTVRAVAAREQISIGAVKQVVLRNIAHGVRMASERVLETIADADCKTATIATGILVDKLQLLTGEATARIEVQSGAGDIFSRFAALHADLIGLPGETKPAKAAPLLECETLETSEPGAIPVPNP